MKNHVVRKRFYSEHLGLNYLNNNLCNHFKKCDCLSKSKKNDKPNFPVSPKIENLQLENIDELENLEILPSEEYEKEEKIIQSYLSTNDDFEQAKKLIPESFKNLEFDITFKKKNYKRMRSKSFSKKNVNSTIFEFLLDHPKH